MTTRLRSVSNRRALIASCCIAALAVLLAAIDGSAQTEAVGPDVTVFDFTDIHSYGSAGGFAAYSLGTNACNRGDKPLNWCDQGSGCAPGATPSDHPAIAQNLYRLKNGRFEQIGMSWLKHGFASLNGPDAGCSGASGQSCQDPPAGENQLGVGCIDPYLAITNGSRPLGRRSEVNAATGAFPYPISPVPATQLYDQRIKVRDTDIDPIINPSALYWIEGHYVAHDDALAGNGLNNASHRQVTVGAAPSYTLTMTGTFFERQPAINAWKMQDPNVTLTNADVPGPVVERFHVGRKVTNLGGGLWHYEYAVHNLNSDRSARAFEVEFPESCTRPSTGRSSRRVVSSPGPPTPSPPTRTPTPCASGRCTTSGSTPTSRRRARSSTRSSCSRPEIRNRSRSRSATTCSPTASSLEVLATGRGVGLRRPADQ
jgi:hypothetical protein